MQIWIGCGVSAKQWVQFHVFVHYDSVTVMQWLTNNLIVIVSGCCSAPRRLLSSAAPVSSSDFRVMSRWKWGSYCSLFCILLSFLCILCVLAFGLAGTEAEWGWISVPWDQGSSHAYIWLLRRQEWRCQKESAAAHPGTDDSHWLWLHAEGHE